MLTKRVISCLDVQNGRTVKGTNFVDIKDAGDPIELAQRYADEGIDELVFLDISATNEGRTTFVQLVEKIGKVINIPFSVGGGISSKDNAYKLLQAGADKVSINSSAIANPKLIEEIANAYGSQCVIVAIDAKNIDGKWYVHTHGGKRNTELDLFDWAHQAESLGAGEILFTSMDHDGTKNGFAIDALSKLNQILTIPLIASGGAGEMNHFYEALKDGVAEAALAASVFHYKIIDVVELKNYLSNKGISIRI